MRRRDVRDPRQGRPAPVATGLHCIPRSAPDRTVTARLGYGVDVGIYPTGGEVDVWYDPADPQRVQANIMGTGAVPSVLVLLGVAVGGVGVLLSYGL